MDQNLKQRIDLGRETVRNQVDFFRRQFSHVQSEWKYDGSRVTVADLTISANIGAALAAGFPEDEFLSEEADPDAPPRALKSGYAWILDPVDGTNNFAGGIPLCAISLALLKDGSPVYGILYDFGRNVIVEGGPGFGLLDGGREVKVFAQRPLDGHSTVSLAFPFRAGIVNKMLPMVERFHIRSMGSGALALTYVALGMMDGCVDLRSKSWDVAAGMAFMAAVGGRVEYFGDSHFPLRTFDVHQKSSPFYAGTDSFCSECGRLLR